MVHGKVQFCHQEFLLDYSGVGCNLGGVVVNILTYADDTVLNALSLYGL